MLFDKMDQSVKFLTKLSLTIIISLSHTLNALVTREYVVILSNVSILLSSLLITTILFISTVYTLW